MNKRTKVQRLRQHFFTGREDKLALFQSLLPLNSVFPIDVLVIHGIGGIGKSELLSQFQMLAQSTNVPVARLDVQVQTSIFDFLMSIYQQLSPIVLFPQFEDALKRHREIESKLLGRTDIPRTALQLFAKGAHSLIKLAPGGGIVTDILSPQHIEAAVNAIYNVVGRKEGDFWMKPEEELTERLLIDLNTYSAQHRLVLLIDTYELIGAFDEWVRERLFADSGEYMLLVIAGRNYLQGKGWQQYAELMLQIELDPFSNDEAYSYLKKKGITDEQVATAMISYSDRHPLTLALVAELAGHINAIDLANVPERQLIIHELLERIIQNVTPNLRIALEACAILRVVNERSLAYMLDQAETREIFEDVRRFDFVKVRSGGIALHDAVWSALNDQLCWRNPTAYRALSVKAAEFYQQELGKATAQARDSLVLEWIYHHIQADEIEGTKLFQERAEELVRYHLVAQLQALLTELNSYNLQEETSKLWRKYYCARLEHLKANFEDAQNTYREIDENEHTEPKLRAYALCDLGYILKISAQNDSSISVLEKSLSTTLIDSKLAVSLLLLGGAYRRIGEFDKSVSALQKARDFYTKTGDKYGLTSTLNSLKYLYLNQGIAAEAALLKEQGIKEIAGISPEPVFLKMELLGGLAIAWTWFGRLSETMHDLQEALKIAFRLGLTEEKIYYYRDLGYVAGLLGKYEEAENYLEQSINALTEITGVFSELEQATTMSFRGVVLMRQKSLQKAEEDFLHSLTAKQSFQDFNGISEVCVWLGELHEIKAFEAYENALANAEFYFQQALSLHWVRRHYFESRARIGLIRVKYAQGDYTVIPSLQVEAEQLAQQYGYNDHLASLRLFQGHMAWEGVLTEPVNSFQAALTYYQQALIFALHYNRFLLDEILWGGGISTPLQPITSFCLKRGDEGRKMLLALCDWWTTAFNDSSISCPTITSSIPQGILLLNAERLVRARETEDGLSQVSVMDHITAALST